MPELPDLTVYVEALRARAGGQVLYEVRVANPFLLRSTDPPLSALEKRGVLDVRRIGKRIVFSLEGDLFLVLHLMIAGRLHWRPSRAGLTTRQHLAAFDFETGTLTLTEAGAKRRASLHVLSGESGLQSVDPGGIDHVDAFVKRAA